MFYFFQIFRGKQKIQTMPVDLYLNPSPGTT